MPYALALLALAVAIPSFFWVRSGRQKSAPVPQAAQASVPALSPQGEVRILAGFTPDNWLTTTETPGPETGTTTVERNERSLGGTLPIRSIPTSFLTGGKAAFRTTFR